MKRPTPEQMRAACSVPCSDVAFATRYPRLVEYLTACAWDDGKPREPSGLSIEMSSGTVKISLHDRALRQSLYTDAPTLEEAWDLLEGVLGVGTAPWRKWKPQEGKRG